MKREKKISLREFSRIIGISPEYLSKIENGLIRAAPKAVTIEKMSNKLELNTEEREMLFDLAAESKANLSVAYDLVEYIHENEIIHKTLRVAKRCNITTDEWQEIFDNIVKKHL